MTPIHGVSGEYDLAAGSLLTPVVLSGITLQRIARDTSIGDPHPGRKLHAKSSFNLR